MGGSLTNLCVGPNEHKAKTTEKRKKVRKIRLRVTDLVRSGSV